MWKAEEFSQEVILSDTFISSALLHPSEDFIMQIQSRCERTEVGKKSAACSDALPTPLESRLEVGRERNVRDA